MNATNSTPINNSQTNFTINNIPDGKYVWSGWANDTTGNSIFGVNYTFTVDTTAPNINFTNPTPDNASTQSEDYVYVNVTTNDTNEHSAWIDWNRSLVGYWGFDSYNSTGIFDNSTYDNFGEFTNGLSTSNITTGKRGLGLEFDGVNDLVNISDIESIGGNSEVCL